MPKIKDHAGKTFGRLTPKQFVGMGHKNQGALWLCDCSCGREKVVMARSFVSGRTKSCGCLNVETGVVVGSKKKHGMCGTKIYYIWSAMRDRCNNPNNKRYSRYGGRGITVCSRWLNFKNFYADMGERPTEHHSIDRIDNEGIYEPRNCKWSTAKEQRNNQQLSSKNRSGIRGVCLRKDGGWQVKFGGQYKGYSKSFFDACCLRKSAESRGSCV